MDMTSSQLQQRFGDVLTQIPQGPVNVIRHNTRVAVVMAPGQYDALCAAADEGLALRIKAAEAEGFLSEEDSAARMAVHRQRASAMTADHATK